MNRPSETNTIYFAVERDFKIEKDRVACTHGTDSSFKLSQLTCLISNPFDF